MTFKQALTATLMAAFAIAAAQPSADGTSFGGASTGSLNGEPLDLTSKGAMPGPD